ncbi:3-hydroxyacyl-CoA dehydrogenase family protein [Brevibacillus sp. FIR094]|uniref:3-hydroxyacyl-CoA dehydrogenase family protein n=1 Tax=Brevibacillus sp. FIR094 TaxID=3134809 RepID=UPI003D1AB2A9
MKSSWKIAIVGSNALAASLRDLASVVSDIELVPLHEGVDIDAVIETTNLDLARKKQNLQQIEEHVSGDTLILSSCLGLTATETASWLSHPAHLVGFATFVQQEEVELVEIAPALQTDSAFLERTCQLFDAMGREIEVIDDQVGLVFPRILSMIINEAVFAWMERVATVEDIDTAMQKGTNYPMGPLAWADEVGIDDVYAVLAGLYRELGEERYRPAALLKKMIYAGWLGKKCGRGFYRYTHQGGKETVA